MQKNILNTITPNLVIPDVFNRSQISRKLPYKAYKKLETFKQDTNQKKKNQIKALP